MDFYLTYERVKRIIDEIARYIYTETIDISYYKIFEGEPAGGEKPETDVSAWNDFKSGIDRWGGRDKFSWFRTQVKIPECFEGKKVAYRLRTSTQMGWNGENPQFLIYVNGRLIQGLDVNHREITLEESARSGEVYDIALHAYYWSMNNGLSDLFSDISAVNTGVEKLYYNIKVPYEILGYVDKDEKKYSDILGYLNNALNMLDLRKPGSEAFCSSVDNSNLYLENEFYGKYCEGGDVSVHCVGHTHIDVAWLWTTAQTRQKVVRSFSTVINLMKEYPEYIFMSSQPQLYKYLKEVKPELYEEVKQKIKEGRWEPEGAMWLEADCNLASGESLIRQIIFGTRFFQEEFGVKNRILWLPDVFGYSAALPQILKKSGIDYFMTTKISWNEYNKMPYDTFMWKGLDGTEILTYFITTQDSHLKKNPYITTYNGRLVPSNIISAWKRYQQKDINNEVLVSFGYGDGGGGPTKEMLENAKRMEKGIPGCPKVKIGRAIDFFDKLNEKVSNNKRLPKWVGELYLEYHRGTYTSMARNKKYNRKSEFLYQDTELMSVANMLIGGKLSYPAEKLKQGWETILKNQFHDILPGSSIKEVYDDSDRDYMKVLADGAEILSDAFEKISSKINLPDLSVVVFNQLSFKRNDTVELNMPDGWDCAEVYDYDGNKMPSQVVDDGGIRKLVFHAEDVPAKGYKAFRLVKTPGCTTDAGIDISEAPDRLSGKFFDIILDSNGNMTSIYDKTNQREVLQKGQKANVIQAFEDKPIMHDAWDINLYYQEKMWEVNDLRSIEIIENGPVRCVVRIQRVFLDSTIIQDIILYNTMPRIDFKMRIDWKEKQILLKAAFPVDVLSSKATYEIQYGNVERPTHWNTGWDVARFEVCAHKWADLSEDGYGVSMLNDCKYGYDIKDNVMRITLLKSAAAPNTEADREIHEFTYSLLPHMGDWRKGGTAAQAYQLNCPLIAGIEQAHIGELEKEFSFVQVDRENVIIEVVKLSEAGDSIIIRMYECYNRRSNVRLSFFKDLTDLWECDLLENNILHMDFTESEVEFEIKPYEIKTFKLYF